MAKNVKGEEIASSGAKKEEEFVMMNPQDMRASEIGRRPEIDDEPDEASLQEFMVEVEICIREGFAQSQDEEPEKPAAKGAVAASNRKEPYRIISPRI